MSKVKSIIRILLGIMLLVFGLNKFLQFMPMPPLPAEAAEFMAALLKSGYIMTIVAIVEIIAGILLVMNRYVALALVIVFPVLLNAFLFHLFLDLPGIGGALVALTMNVYLMFVSKDSYAGILKPD